MEEDIKIVKEIKKEFITKMKKDITHNDNPIYYRNIQALQNILNELERIQKENERLKEKHKITCELNVGLLENMKECIPKQKIRDKLKELENTNGYFMEIAILEELLGE